MWCRVSKSQKTCWPKFQIRLGRICWGRIFPKFLRGILSPLSPLTSDKIWLALCGKPDNDEKCGIFIGWVTMSQRFKAFSEPMVTKRRSTFRGHTVDWHLLFRRSMRRFIPEICGVEWRSREKDVGQKFQLRLGRFLGGANFPKLSTVHSKPLKLSNIWQNVVGLGSVAFMCKARQWRKMRNFHSEGHNEPTDISRFWVKGREK